MTEKQEIFEIDLKRILSALWRRAWLILVIGVITTAISFSYAVFFVTPQYAASVKLYVNNTYGANNPGFSSSQLTAAQSLADTYMVILESRDVLQEVIETTGLPYTYGQLRDMVQAQSVNETEVFQVVVVCPNNLHAAKLANAIADVLPDKIAAVVDGSSVRVVEYAVATGQKVSPDYVNRAVVGLLIGCVLSAGVIAVKAVLDKTITSEEYLSQTYGHLPLLAVIPDAEDQKSSGYYRGYYETRKKTKGGGEC